MESPQDMRHFKVKTAAGAEDIHCDDFDDSDEKEYWFIFYNKPRLVFQKANVISIQEQQPFDQQKWDEIVRASQMPEATYEPEEEDPEDSK
jgi:hypothetical protein